MKTIRIVTVAGAVVALAVSLQAQPSAHYAPGVEGIKAATLPPPGGLFPRLQLLLLGRPVE